MSGVAVINYLLSNDSGVTAVVPAARIFTGPIPLGTTLPAIGVLEITGGERLTVAMTETGRLRDERVQVVVHARDYATKKALIALVRTACPDRKGTVAGVKLDSILPDIIGPDLDDPPLFEQSRDFRVKWNTA